MGGGLIYFWSDTHFNHAGIMRHCPKTRGHYGSVSEMNDSLISRWNSVVGPTDSIHLLGDFAFKTKEGIDLDVLFNALHGHKHLIVGNHDEKNPAVLKLPWESVRHLGFVKYDSKKVAVCHYPMETWASAHHGVPHLHGHSHGTLKRQIPHRYDVGADVYERPVSWDEIWDRAGAEVFNAQDHHGSDL